MEPSFSQKMKRRDKLIKKKSWLRNIPKFSALIETDLMILKISLAEKCKTHY